MKTMGGSRKTKWFGKSRYFHVAGWKSAYSIGRIRWFAQVGVKPLFGRLVSVRQSRPARARGLKLRELGEGGGEVGRAPRGRVD